MINISEVVKNWPINTDFWPVDANEWRISPGVDWCAKGNRIRVGKNCWLGERSILSDYFGSGNNFSAGPGFRACPRSNVGYNFFVGENFLFGPYLYAGDNFVAGDNAVGVTNLGRVDGWNKSLSYVGDVAYIGSGCRWFTLAEALEHWGSHEEDRRRTMALLEGAKALATLDGKSFGAV